MLDRECGGVVRLVDAKSRRRNIDGSDVHPGLDTHVHLPASATRMQESRAITKVGEDEPFELWLDDSDAIERCDELVGNRARHFLLVPVRVPSLRVNESRVDLSEGSFYSEPPGVCRTRRP